MQAQEAKPAYVDFEYRAVEDREASIAAGGYVAKNVAYALITPQGSRDKVEKIAEEWLAQMSVEAQQQRIPQAFAAHYKAIFKLWKEEGEVPITGTPIKTWPPCSPAQVATLLAVGVKTVEDLAICNEETIARLGMGGRALKQEAANWVEAKAGTGKVAAEITALQVENTNLKQRNESLEAQIKAIGEEVKTLSAARKL